ncbi:MAG TPA: HNH endonuclease, partial [Anaeromyxobacteraceae bacterium]|nr:HNH endonuclease [Anaeromyxobacteraceae bacterium]
DVWCLVPGCSRPMDDAHHLEFRSRGGTDDGKNLAADCKFHHLRVIHGGHLVAFGEAPHAIAWLRKGKPFTGMAED